MKYRNLILFLSVCVLLVAPAIVYSVWFTGGTGVCTATGGQERPNVVPDGSGGAIFVWDDGRSGGDSDIYVQRVNADGAVLWTVDGVAACTTSGDQLYSAITSDGSGGAIVTWQDQRDTDFEVYAQRVDHLGQTLWATNGVAACTTSGDQTAPTIISDGAGGAIIVWEDQRSGGYDIYAQRLDANGVIQWAPDGIAISTSASSGPNYHYVVTDEFGGAIVSWVDDRNGIQDVYAQRVDNAGAVLWTVNGVTICDATGYQWYAANSSDGSGGAIISWVDLRSGEFDIYAQRVNASGVVQWTPNGVPICTAAGNQGGFPGVVSDGSGGAIVSWEDPRGGNYDVYAQRVNASGVVQWTTDGVAVCTAAGDQAMVKSVSDGSGGTIFTWEDPRGLNVDIYAQRVSGSGIVQWAADGVAFCAAAGDQLKPRLVSDGSGAAIIVWEDNRAGTLQPDIYAVSTNAQYLAEADVCYATLGNGDPDRGALITIDLTTGAGSIVGPTGITGEFGDLGVPSLAIKFSGEIYAMDIGTSSNLYRINASTGAATLVGPSGLSSPPAIGFDGNDVLHAIDSKGDLYKVNHLTGIATFVAATGKFIKGIAFDPLTGTLWGTDASSNVYTINPRTGATTLVGNTGGNPSPDICFGTSNELIASTGGGLTDNNLVWLNKSTGAVDSLIGPIGYRSVSGMALRHDRVSPVVVQAFNAQWTNRYVEIVWRLIDVSGVLSFDITRASGDTGGRETIRDARVTRRGEAFIFEDRSTEPGNTYSYRIAIQEDGEPVATFETSITTPSGRLVLDQNHPNPFNPTTSISFSIARDVHVVLAVYDISGRRVATLVDRPMHAGRNTERWDGRDSAGNPVATGVYFFRLTAGTRTLTRKANLIK